MDDRRGRNMERPFLLLSLRRRLIGMSCLAQLKLTARWQEHRAEKGKDRLENAFIS